MDSDWMEWRCESARYVGKNRVNRTSVNNGSDCGLDKSWGTDRAYSPGGIRWANNKSVFSVVRDNDRKCGKRANMAADDGYRMEQMCRTSVQSAQDVVG